REVQISCSDVREALPLLRIARAVGKILSDQSPRVGHVSFADVAIVFRVPFVCEPMILPGTLGLPAEQVVKLEMTASGDGIASQAASGSTVEPLRAGPVHDQRFASAGETRGVAAFFGLVLYIAKLSRPALCDLAPGGHRIAFRTVCEADHMQSQPGLAQRLA